MRIARQPSLATAEPPISAELFGPERLKTYALELAAAHRVNFEKKSGRDLLARLQDNSRHLFTAQSALAEAVSRGQALTPAAEWLIDNFHIVEEQLREIRQDLPRSFYRELPKLTDGDFAGYPRVYHLALEAVAHTDNRLDNTSLASFLEAYQEHSPLKIGEIWAFPISLRLALIENLRRFAVKILSARLDRLAADDLADSLSAASDEDFSSESVDLLSVTFGNSRLTDKFSDTFIVQLAARLRDGNRVMSFALETLEARLRREGQTLEHLAHKEHYRQAAAQVSVANIITSMRLLSILDWQEFFERVSLIDRVLREDPANAYASMDFPTRDRYRHHIERISKRTGANELEIARRAIDFASHVADSDDSNAHQARQTHVGFFLFNINGLAKLERAFDYRLKIGERLGRLVHRYPTFAYLSSLIALTALIIIALIYLTPLRNASIPVLSIVILLAIIPTSELALTIINRLVLAVFKPRLLPKMDLTEGIPAEARTFVVIPTLLANEEVIKDLCGQLEIYFLANRDEELYFALLGDLADATSETTPEDEPLRARARLGIAELNQKYVGHEGAARFFFFTRRREWNAGEEKWISKERKRGNLHEFNSLLRGQTDSSFICAETVDFAFLKTIRYVITLDADTQLPRDAARKLVGTIRHPLNRPVFNRQLGRVTEGYGILQPRIEVSLPSSLCSPFARIFSDSKGVDPYTTAVSDVYQDLFGEGSYVGKGLYDVDTFEAALDQRIPANRLLSHDLFEGLYARVALVTDIVFYDDYPASYETAARRQHRWTRGDWQIARWLLPFVPDADGRTVRNRLPLIARWKILDNLRRSLVAATLILWLAVGWSLPLTSSLEMTLFALLVLTAPLYLQAATVPVFALTSVGWKNYLVRFSNFWSDIKTSAVQLFFRFAFLAHEAANTIDAIVRVIYRKMISGKFLLEWVAAAQHDRESRRSFGNFLGFMIASPIIAIIIFAFAIVFDSRSLILAAPFLLLWLFAPNIAFRLSRRTVAKKDELDQADAQWLRLVARRTWRYFETFVGQGDHWLPPDNFQQDPHAVIAHRTSPTNIGMLLLSTIAARDFGYMGTLETIERIELTCTTLERLSRFRGHFYNWYDTQTLEPLMPQYISTVDSGNLAGHLLAVAQGCLEMAQTPLFDERIKRGFGDTLVFIKREVKRLESREMRVDSTALKRLRTETQKCEEVLAADAPVTSAEWQTMFETLVERGQAIHQTVSIHAQKVGAESFSELDFWTTALVNLAKNCRRDIQILAPAAAATNEHERAAETQQNFAARVESIANFCRRLVDEMDFAFLYDSERKVLTIGYRPTENVRDNSFYDLLASEARLASFIAVASGDVEQEHWFRLGRALVKTTDGRALVSWSGTMFEYLMPLLVMRDYEGTLLSETCATIVRRQIEYGNQHDVPWGVSEAAYNARDLQFNYQYGPFGVPGLGLKRGLADDFVIAPYATALAAPLAPHEAIANLRRLAEEGMVGSYGFYESVDYTKERVPPEQTCVRIEAYMTHHQGMILVALDNLLHDEAMQHRFHREPMVESAELLLQERIPRLSAEIVRPRAAMVLTGHSAPALTAPAPRRYTTAEHFSPSLCLLSNGEYAVMLTTAGSGYSRCKGLAVTRWREDAVRDNWGSFIYLRDARSGAVWSSGVQPTLRAPQNYTVTFTESKATFRRRDAGILTQTEIIVATDDNAELRRVTIINESMREREIELTSYAEIVLNAPAADDAHPAFSNLFIETEFDAPHQTLLARRRPRSGEDQEVWGAHTIYVEGKQTAKISYQTDRARFLGRGRTTQNAQAAFSDQPLGNVVGTTLDPIFSLRVRVVIQPGATATIVLSTLVAETRERALESADKYRDAQSFERAEKLAWTRSQVELRHLGISTDEANLFQRLAGRLIYADASLRPRPDVLKLNQGTQPDLWKYGISGDLPMMIVRVSESDDARSSVRQILRAHEYLRMKNLVFDLVILNDQPASYEQSFGEDLQDIIRAMGAQAQLNTSGGIFLRRTDIMPEPDRILLHTAARVCFVTERGTLEEQLTRELKQESPSPPFVPRRASRSYTETLALPPVLSFPNDVGGFTERGREYRITLSKENETTPAPWSNVIANERDFGFLVTEAGASSTWSVNSRENRLTVWSNDAVSDPPAECIYLRDEETGSFWTPTALPVRENLPYVVRHGQGYSIFEHTSHGIRQELLMFAPVDASVKISRLRLQNLTDRQRRLSITHYCEFVLGVDRAKNAPFIITKIDATTGAIFARNPYNNEFAGRVAFVATNAETHAWTCDRREFLGRNNSLARPAAMLRENLSGANGAGLDPCSALQTVIDLQPGETREIVFLLGEEESKDAARDLVSRFRSKEVVESEFRRVIEFWDKLLGTIEVTTPDAALNLLMNRWLIYQTLACRFWARTAFYQSSGAYGFRDQLQDAMALTYARPDLARAHILRAAAHQFTEGDVQHWWHEPTGRGVRTRISDDLLWLIYVTLFYVQITGETGIWDESVPFLAAPPLAENEDEKYLQPAVSPERDSIYEHCLRAADISLKVGAHGLPLMGAGDWSDGMNRVGKEGKGESVWLGWFLAGILKDFGKTCEKRGDTKHAERYRAHLQLLKKNLKANAWDGDWYLRAFFDDGTPLGSRANEECQIDSIAQSWSVMSGASNEARARQAMQAVTEHLILEDEKLALLLTPPFDKTAHDPGYIKGYLPGLRENGGQYTHAATWLVVAFALLGEGDQAGQLLSLLNPINHAQTAAELSRYKTEPYVIAADVYAAPQQMGRGGWTWYTGAAGWLYRAGLESVLGFKKYGSTLTLEPCIPREWREFEIIYRYGTAVYQIKVENPDGVQSGIRSLEINGKTLKNARLKLVDDGQSHAIRIVMGSASSIKDSGDGVEAEVLVSNQ